MARRAAFAISLAALVASYTHSAEARGRHGSGRGGHGLHGAHVTGERDNLLDTKIKSICRGC